jgi:LAO/AO transport system kinase
MKAGVLEIADVLVVNKADLPLAQRTTDQLRDMLKLRHDKRDVPIVETVAIKDTGVDTLLAAIEKLLAARAGDRQKARERRMRRLIAQTASRLIDDRLLDHAGAEMQHLIKAAAAGEISIAEAAEKALQILR